jgi:hypothetical protein
LRQDIKLHQGIFLQSDNGLDGLAVA